MSRGWRMGIAAMVVAWGCAAGARGAEDGAGDAGRPLLCLETGGHTAMCNWLGFTPDGANLISLGDDKVVRIWDVRDSASPRLQRSLRLQTAPGPEGKLYAGALSPDGRWLAVGGWTADHEVRVLELATARIAAVLREHENVIHGLAFSSDGRYSASASADKTVRVWDLEELTGEEGSTQDEGRTTKKVETPCQVLEGHTDSVRGVAFVPGSHPLRLVSGARDKTARLWQRQDDGKWTTQAVLRGHAEVVDRVAASPDGRWIATSAKDRSVRLWRAENGEFVKVLGTKAGTFPVSPAIAFSPDSSRLVAGDRKWDDGAVVWSVPEGKQLAGFDGHDNTVMWACFSPDGKRVASTGGNDNDIYLWDPQSGAELGHVVGRGSSVFGVAFSPDGQRLAFGRVNQGRTLAADHPLMGTFDLLTMERDATAGQPPRFSDYIRGALAADGFAAEVPADATNTLVIKRAGREVSRISRWQSHDRIRCYAFLPGRGQIAVGSEFEFTLHEVASGKFLRTFRGHTGLIWAVAISPDGRFLLSGAGDQTVRLWSLESTPAEVAPLLSFFFARDGQWVAWTEKGYYKASSEGDSLIGWHLNQGLDQPARFLHAWQLRNVYHWPDLIRLLPAAGSVERAIAMYNQDPRHQRRQELDVQTAARRLLPPEVTITGPKPYSLVQATTVRLQAKVALPETADQSLPVTVRVMVNDRPVPGWDQHRVTLEPRSQPKAAAGEGPATRNIILEGSQTEVDVDVPLVPGENLLSVVAWTELSTGDPTRVRITCRPPAGSARDKPDMYVLAVGVSKYQDPKVKSLAYADKDAIGLVETFRQQAGRTFGKVAAYTVDERDPQSLLVNQRATRRNILRGLGWLRKSVTQVDLAVVCVSGHGSQDGAGSYFFIPHDYEDGDLEGTGLRWSEFQDPLSKLPCPVLLVMDTCHAAGVTGQQRSTRELGAEQESWTNFIAEVTKVKSGLYVFSAALPQQKALEDAKWGHGALALAVMEGVTGRRLYPALAETELPADANGNGLVELNELRTYVVRRVKELTRGFQHATALPRDLPALPLAPVR